MFYESLSTKISYFRASIHPCSPALTQLMWPAARNTHVVNAHSNRNVFNWRLNALWSWSSAGNALGLACEKQRSPNLSRAVAVHSDWCLYIGSGRHEIGEIRWTATYVHLMHQYTQFICDTMPHRQPIGWRPLMSRAAAFWTHCNGATVDTGRFASTFLQ